MRGVKGVRYKGVWHSSVCEAWGQGVQAPAQLSSVQEKCSRSSSSSSSAPGAGARAKVTIGLG